MRIINYAKSILLALCLSSTAQANVLGDMQTFSPNTDGLDFITVHSARPLPKDFWVFSNYLNYAKDHLLVYKTLSAQDRLDYEDSLIEYDLGVAYGFSENLQFSFQMPVLVSHSTRRQDGVLVNIKEGIHSFRPGFKWGPNSTTNSHWALLGSVDIPFLKNSPYMGVDSNPIFNLEGAYSWSHGSRIQSLNVGGRLRNPTDTPTDAHMFPLKSQLTASYGYSDKFSQTARWVFETFASMPIDKAPYNEIMDASSIDVLLGLKHRWYKNLNFDWGATVEPGVKSLAPSYRFFAGLVYYWKPEKKSEASGSKETLQPFVVYPDIDSVETFEWVQFYAEGDIQIDTCKITEGPGTLSQGCEFMSQTPGVARIEFRDTFGRTVNKYITVVKKEASPVKFKQPKYTVLAGSSVQVEAQGGAPEYEYKVIRGQGTMSFSGFYEAPLRKQTVLIQATDQNGQTAQGTIEVVEAPKADRALDLNNLEFFTDKAELTPSALKSLRANLSGLRKVNIKRLIVEGHTDSVGSDEYNQRLSRRRAKTVKNILIGELGLPASSIEAVGFGESQPIASNATAEGRQRNRRVVLKVYYK